MKLSKPLFWDKKTISFISILLYPFTLITMLIIVFKKNFFITKKFNIPVICVGNIYIGGTSKTPTSVLISKRLSGLGLKTAIIRKYYEDHVDEHKLIKHNYDNLILCRNRNLGITEAEKEGFDTVVLDDGLQDYTIEKNLSIVCFHQNQLIGNGLVLPSGPLRENLNTLKNAKIILINGNRVPNFEKKLLNVNKNLEIFYSQYKPENISQFKNQRLLALAGIANPENFFKLLEENNLTIEEKLSFPDHHRFNEKEIQNIINKAKLKNLKIIVTEKDFFKLNEFKLEDINYLKVSLSIHNEERLIERIKNSI